MIEPGHPGLSVGKQCSLLSMSRSSFYCAPKGESEMMVDFLPRSVGAASAFFDGLLFDLPSLFEDGFGPTEVDVAGVRLPRLSATDPPYARKAQPRFEPSN